MVGNKELVRNRLKKKALKAVSDGEHNVAPISTPENNEKKLEDEISDSEKVIEEKLSGVEAETESHDDENADSNHVDDDGHRNDHTDEDGDHDDENNDDPDNNDEKVAELSGFWKFWETVKYYHYWLSVHLEALIDELTLRIFNYYFGAHEDVL